MKKGRTEHAMAVIDGILAVIGGYSESEFFSSVEKFEDSASDRYSFAREWKVSNQVNIHYDIIF